MATFSGKVSIVRMKQLSAQERKFALLRAKQGDQESFERLLEDYSPLISSLVQNALQEYSFAGSDYEDLYQEAVLLFCRALDKYNTEQSDVAFGLFAKICIRNGLSTQAKKMKRRIQTVSVDDANETELEKNCTEELSDRLVEEESYRVLYECIRSTLSSYENRVWWLYLAGRTAKEIADELDTDEKSVQNAVYRIRRKLRGVIPQP